MFLEHLSIVLVNFVTAWVAWKAGRRHERNGNGK